MPELDLPNLINDARRQCQAGDFASAEASCRQVLALDANHIDALGLLGRIAGQSGRHDLAAQCLNRAEQLRPDLPEFPHNLGNVLMAQGNLDAAIAAWQRALAIQPGLAASHFNMGNALKAQGNLDAALAAYQKALALDPNYAEALQGMGNLLTLLERKPEAMACYQRAVSVNPKFARAWNNLGLGLDEQGERDQAIACFARAIEAEPLAAAYNNMGKALIDCGRIDDAIASYRRAVELDPGSAAIHSNLVFALLLDPGASPDQIYREHRRWNDIHAAPLRRAAPPPVPPVPRAGGKLRVGYVSADFREHPVGRSVLALLENHDKQEFEIYVYGDVARPDQTTAAIRQHADVWTDTANLPDERLAEIIARHEINVLVDLGLHSAQGRLGVFARRPAAAQVAWAGYPGTTGLDAINWRVGDVHVDPPEFDAYSSERILRLTGSFWCFATFENTPAIVRRPAGAVTFGSFNSFAKVNPNVLALWARVLREVQESRLLLLAPKGHTRDTTAAALKNLGIDPARIHFVDRRPRDQYLALYNSLDIVLDTFPYAGHSTSVDALWMGVPVVSLSGHTPVSRGGLSILSNVGLADLVTDSPDRYVAVARQLARDTQRREALRQTLRDTVRMSRLMDGATLAREMEAFYRMMTRA